MRKIGLSMLLAAFSALFPALSRAEDAPKIDAKAAALIELNTGRLLYAHNENEALPMASTTKVMTALLALEHSAPDDVVVAGHNAYGVPGTSIYLGEGESLRMGDLLQGLMLASGNDAAVAIAEHISGSVSEFAKLMTARAQKLGCEKTTFLTPHGLPMAGHQTTAYELALIAREAMQNDAFRALVSTSRSAIPWAGRSYDRILNNKNRLLTEYEGATGIKTGYTKAAGRCLVFGAKRAGMEVVGVVLNCPDWFEQAKRLLDHGFETYELFDAYRAGEMVRLLPVTDGKRDTVAIVTQTDLLAPIRRGELPLLEIDLPDRIPAGAEQGEAVGIASLSLRGEILASTPLVLQQAAPARDYADDLGAVLERFLTFPQ